MKGQAVIVLGNFSEGHYMIGPFSTWDAAAQYQATSDDTRLKGGKSQLLLTLLAPKKPDLTTTREAVERKHS